MAIDSKFGIVLDQGAKLGIDEPVFVIRARDKAAPAAIRDYAERAAFLGSPGEHVEACYDVARKVETWQAQNPALVKVPD